MKIGFYLLAVLFFGYIGLNGLLALGALLIPSWQVNATKPILVTICIMGAIGIFAARYFWKKIGKELAATQPKNE